MKKGICIVIAAALSLSACSKGDAPTAPGSALEPAAVAAKGRLGYVMLQGLSLWNKDGDSAVWAKTATLGDSVGILGKPVQLEYKGATKEYSRIAMSDGAEYYARTPYIVEATKLAVVKSDKCVIHNEPRIIGATTGNIPYLTVVAVLDAAITDGFIKVSYANADSSMVSEKWIKRDTVIDGAVDISAAVSLAVVNAIDPKNKDQRINILEGAADSYAASAFASDISNLLVSLKGGPALALLPAAGAGVANDGDVNVRSAPSVDSGSLGKLSLGDDVETVERTADTYDVGGVIDHWYHVVKPVDGWVFGSFIDFGSVDN